jgi:hypothetical protein
MLLMVIAQIATPQSSLEVRRYSDRMIREIPPVGVGSILSPPSMIVLENEGRYRPLMTGLWTTSDKMVKIQTRTERGSYPDRPQSSARVSHVREDKAMASSVKAMLAEANATVPRLNPAEVRDVIAKEMLWSSMITMRPSLLPVAS